MGNPSPMLLESEEDPCDHDQGFMWVSASVK